MLSDADRDVKFYARAALKVKGFCAIKKGTPLYKKAKELMK